MLAALRQTLKPGGVLFSSNPRGDGREGWTAGRYGAFYGLSAWRGHMRAAGFVELTQYYRPAGLPLEQPSWLASVWRKPASVPARGALRDRAERTAEGADGQAAFAERLAVGPTRTASRSRIGARAREPPSPHSAAGSCPAQAIRRQPSFRLWAASESCCWRWNDAQLHHQSQRVHDDARVPDFPAFQAIDDHAPHRHSPIRGRHAEKCPSMRARPLEA